MAPALIQGQIRSLKVLRRSLSFEASSQALKRLGSPFRKRYDRKLVSMRRSLVKRIAAISAAALRRALKDAGAVVRADHSKAMRRAIRAVRRALRTLRHADRRGLPRGLWFVPVGLETVRSIDPSAPPPPPGLALTTIDFDDPALADQVLTNQYAARGVTFNYAEVYGQPGPGSANCGPPAVRAQAGAPSPPQVARLGNCPLDPMNPWYSGTFGAFGSPKTTVRAQVHMSTTCDGPCFAPVTLVAYNSLGTVVASGSANVPLGGWAPISASLPPGQPASISYFAIYREGSWQGTLAIDDLAFDAS
jgi:hypothetical protein